MVQRTVTSLTREAVATIVTMLLTLGATAVVATLLALAATTVVAVILMLVVGLPLADGRSPTGRSSRYKPLGPLLVSRVGARVPNRLGSLDKTQRSCYTSRRDGRKPAHDHPADQITTETSSQPLIEAFAAILDLVQKLSARTKSRASAARFAEVPSLRKSL